MYFYSEWMPVGHGTDPDLEKWKERAAQGVLVVKVAQVGNDGESLLQAITRFTNSQNAVRERDFLALTNDFRSWQTEMAKSHDIYLEVQRGGWDSQRAIQKQKISGPQFTNWANAADLLKVYGAGWLGEAGMAFGKNPPFLPNGTIFRRIMEADAAEERPFSAEDLYAAYLLQTGADRFKFGRSAEQPSRRQTRFLFYMTFVDLVKEIIVRAGKVVTRGEITKAIVALLPDTDAGNELLDRAIDAIDSYLTPGSENSIFDEPAYITGFNNDLNGFLKWEKLRKSEHDCPRYRQLIAMQKLVLGTKLPGTAENLRDRARHIVYG